MKSNGCAIVGFVAFFLLFFVISLAISGGNLLAAIVYPTVAILVIVGAANADDRPFSR